MGNTNERKNPNVLGNTANNGSVEFDSLPYETRKEIIEKLEAVGTHYDKLIQQKNNENN